MSKKIERHNQKICDELGDSPDTELIQYKGIQLCHGERYLFICDLKTGEILGIILMKNVINDFLKEASPIPVFKPSYSAPKRSYASYINDSLGVTLGEIQRAAERTRRNREIPSCIIIPDNIRYKYERGSRRPYVEHGYDEEFEDAEDYVESLPLPVQELVNHFRR